MNRRGFLVVGLLGSTSLASAAVAQQPVTLIYVGGWDCGPCISWKNNKKADWLASKERSQVNYVEIESPKLKEAYEDRYWPQELRPIRDQLSKKSGTPRFILVKDGKVLSSEWGSGEWDRTWQKLRELLI
jgi:hypothetical protein